MKLRHAEKILSIFWDMCLEAHSILLLGHLAFREHETFYFFPLFGCELFATPSVSGFVGFKVQRAWNHFLADGIFFACEGKDGDEIFDLCVPDRFCSKSERRCLGHLSVLVEKVIVSLLPGG